MIRKNRRGFLQRLHDVTDLEESRRLGFLYVAFSVEMKPLDLLPMNHFSCFCNLISRKPEAIFGECMIKQSFIAAAYKLSFLLGALCSGNSNELSGHILFPRNAVSFFLNFSEQPEGIFRRRYDKTELKDHGFL